MEAPDDVAADGAFLTFFFLVAIGRGIWVGMCIRCLHVIYVYNVE